jgi:predicted dehydrogenase
MSEKRKLKIGVLGAGHLGRIHLRLIGQIEGWELTGFYDPDDDQAAKAMAETGSQRFNRQEDLLSSCDAIDIVTPTLTHFDLAATAIRAGKHVFIEKPVTQTVEEAKKLMRLASEANITAQVGHVERFNPAYVASLPYQMKPMFIETHRLAQFNPRGTDVSVVLDLMIHDIDIVLSLNHSGLKKISASGVAVISETPDIANARLEFNDGCVANLTASRISMKNMRKSRLFQRDAYLSIDFLEKEVQIIRLGDEASAEDVFSPVIDPGHGRPARKIHFENPEVPQSNAILEELRAFHAACLGQKAPPVTLEDGMKALEVANKIIEKLKISGQLQ